MAHEPIVSRLQVNLSWKAWLKTLFIHPSVTEAAKDNMKEVRKMKQRLQEAKGKTSCKSPFSWKSYHPPQRYLCKAGCYRY